MNAALPHCMAQALKAFAPPQSEVHRILADAAAPSPIAALIEALKSGYQPSMPEIAALLYELDGVVSNTDGFESAWGDTELLADRITAILQAREADGVEP